MEPPKDTFDRFFSVADALYEQADRAAFPTVDAVRKTARVNMNDANADMKQCRRIHMTHAASVAIPVPERVGIAQVNTDAEHAATDKARQDAELADSRRQLASALAGAERTEARAIEIERRAFVPAHQIESIEVLLLQSCFTGFLPK